MGTLGTRKLNLMDHAKRIDPDGKIARIAEVMNEVNEVLTDMVVIEGNLPTGHKTTMRTGLPSATWRKINQGVQPNKSSTAQNTFTSGLLEAHGQVDEELVEIATDKAAFRLSENAPHIEGMSQDLATTIFYGDVTVNPERFMGLAPYYSAIASSGAGAQIINAGGSGDVNTSLWLVVWGENTIHGFYPKGSRAGIEHKDLGLDLVEDGITPGAKYRAYVDQYKAKMGIAVRDYRYAVRIANIDVSDLATAGDAADSSANIIKFMIQALNKVPSLNAGRAAFYCNKTVKTALDIKAYEKANVQLTISELQNGSTVTKFLGVPIRRVDAILDIEAAIS